MVKKTLLWLRFIILVVALVAGQLQVVLAHETPVTQRHTDSRTATGPAGADAANVWVESSPAPTSTLRINDSPRAACKLKVTGKAVKEVPPDNNGDGVPDFNPAEPGADLVLDDDPHEVGDILTIVVIVRNYTFEGAADPGSNCVGETDPQPTQAEVLSDVEAEIRLGDGDSFGATVSAVLNFPTEDGVLNPGDAGSLGEWAYFIFDFAIPATVTTDTLTITTIAGAETEVDRRDGIAPDDTIDKDNDTVTIQGPGFQVVSFGPTIDPPEASPGDTVDFLLEIQGTRDTPIDGINVVSTADPPIPQFPLACNDLDNWTTVPDGDPVTQINKDDTVQCLITGVPIPSDPAPKEFAPEVEITATAGGQFPVTQTVQADPPIAVKLPEISVEKRVKEIRRQGQAIYTAPGPVPSVAPADVITYEITVENTGALVLEDIEVVDSLTGYVTPPSSLPVYDDADPEANKFTAETTHTVSPDSEDPLTNTVSVSARAPGFISRVDDTAVVSVDVLDSALTVELAAFDPDTGDPITTVVPGQKVRYRLTLTNDGLDTISDIEYGTLPLTQQTYADDPPGLPDLPASLGAGEQRVLTWFYTVLVDDPDPLISTVKVRGLSDQGRLLYGQGQYTLDISNPDIEVAAVVLEPETDAVLRGSDIVMEVTVTNKNSVDPVCSVVVNQYRVDPDTGRETLIAAGISLAWPDPAQPQRIGPLGSASTTLTYLVTGEDKDPLQLIFEVQAVDNCPAGEALEDRTSKVLDISDAQVNAEIIPDLGDDGVATIGETIPLTYVATNVGAVTLENLSATWCIPPRGDEECDNIFSLSSSLIDSFETTSGSFSYKIRAEDADISPFVVEVTLLGTDNQGKQVSIKTAINLVIGSEKLQVELAGPTNAVIGDEHTFDYTIVNNTGQTLTNVKVYNLLEPDPDDADKFLEVGAFETILGDEGQNVEFGDFLYRVKADKVVEGTLTMRIRVVGTLPTGDALASAEFVVTIVPIIGVLKLGTPEFAIPGDQVTFSVTITNNSIEQDLTVTSVEDAILDDYGITVNVDSFGANPENWPSDIKGVLNATQSIAATFVIPSVDAAPNPLVNQFIVNGVRSWDDAAVVGFGSASVEIGCPVDIEFDVVNLDDDPDYVLGEMLEWTIAVRNVTTEDLSSVSVDDTLGLEGPIDVGSLAAGQVVTFDSFTKPITDDLYTAGDDFMADEVTVTFTEVAGVASCAETLQVFIYSPVVIRKTADKLYAPPGTEVTYTFELFVVTEEDDAPYDSFYVYVSDELMDPADIAFDFNEDGVTDPGEIRGWVDWTHGENNSFTTTQTRVVKESDPDELTNRVIAEFPVPGKDDRFLFTWSDAVVFTGSPLELTKTPSSLTEVVPGTIISYDYTLANVSPFELKDVELVDDVIGNLIPTLTGGTLTIPAFTAVPIPELVGIEYLVPLEAPDPLVNTVTATGTLVNDQGEEQEFTTSVTVSVDLLDPDLDITKIGCQTVTGDTCTQELPDVLPASMADGDGVPEAGEGDTIYYCFTVTNNNPVEDNFVEEILVEDPLLGAGALQQAFIDAMGRQHPDHSQSELTTLYGGEDVSFCTDQITATRATGDPALNTVSVQGKSYSGFDIYNEATLAIDIVGQALLVTKIPSQTLAFVGQEIFYTIRIENKNVDSDLVNIEAFDAFEGAAPAPLDLNLFDWTNSGVSGNPVGELAKDGGYAEYTYSYTVRPEDPVLLTNTAIATAEFREDGGVVEDATRATVAVTSSQLLITKEATPNVAQPGDEVQYTISITNIGTIPVYNLMAVDRFQDADGPIDPPVEYPGTALTDDQLDPYETAFLTYSATMPSEAELDQNGALDPFINEIAVYGVVFDNQGVPVPFPDPDDPDPYVIGKSLRATATESVDIIQPNIRVRKQSQLQATAPGVTVPYDIVITNTGGEGDILDQIVVTDLPSVILNLDQLCPGDDCPFVYGAEPYDDYDQDENTPDQENPKRGLQYDPTNIPDGVPTELQALLNPGLDTGEQLIGTIEVTVPSDFTGSEYTNTVEVTAKLDTEDVQDRASDTIDIRDAGINVEKIASVTTAPIGTEITYTIRVTNVGGVSMDRLDITDAGIDAEPDGTATITGGFPATDEGDETTFDAEEVYEYTYTHVLTSADGDPYKNRATVRATDLDTGATALNVAEATVDVQGYSVEIEKYVCIENSAPPPVPSPCTSTAQVGDTVYYYVHISNPSNEPLQNLVVTDSLVSGMPGDPFASLTWPAPNDGLAAFDGAVSDDDELWVVYAYTVQPGDIDPLTNTVRVTGESATDTPVPVDDVASATLTLVSSDLQLTKTAQAQAIVGASVTYTLTVENLGTAGQNITEIDVVDPLSPSGSDPLCEVETLTPGQSVECGTFQYTVQAGDPSPLVNTAVATGTQNSAEVSDTSTHQLEIVTPGLSVTKQADVTVANVGDTITFTYRIENTGTAVLGELDVQDDDPNIVFDAAWPEFLAPGDDAVRTAQRTITASDPDPYVNTVTVTGTVGGQPRMATATETVFIANGSLVVENTPNRVYATPDQEVTFTYTIRNLGGDTLTGLELRDGLCTATDETALDGQLASTELAPGASVTVYCVAQAQLPGPLVSTLTARATEPGVGDVVDTAVASVDVTQGGLLVTKSADRATIPPDSTITYTVEVMNVGTETLTDINVDDPVVALSPAPPATLSAGQSFIMTGTYLVPATDAPASVSNTVMVTATGVDTDTDYSDTASASVAVVENPSATLVLTKEAAAGRVNPSDPVDYTFTIRNVSATNIANITLEDPPGTSIHTIDLLGPGNVATFQYQGTVPSDVATPTYTNTAQVLAGGEAQDDASATVDVQLLTLTKTPRSATTLPGGTIVFDFEVTNLSLGTVSNVTLEDLDLDSFTTVLPGDVPLTGESAVGEVTLDGSYTVGTFFENTARLYVDDVLQDEATASVEVVAEAGEMVISDLTIVDDSSSQEPKEGPVRSGRRARIAFTLENLSALEIDTLDMTVNIDGEDVECAPDADLPDTLLPTDTAQVSCLYSTPKAGNDSYQQTGGLSRAVTITVIGTDENDVAVEATATGVLELVDLKLQLNFTVINRTASDRDDPDTEDIEVEVGDEIDFRVELENVGASSIGCDDTVPADDPCHIKLAGESTWGGFEDLLNSLSGQFTNVVLESGDTKAFETVAYDQDGDGNPDPIYEVTADVPEVTFKVLTESGSTGHYKTGWSADKQSDYTVRSLEVTQVIQIPGSEIEVSVTINPNPPIYGAAVQYTVQVRNVGSMEVTNLTATYQIVPKAAYGPTNEGIVLTSGGQHPAAQTTGTITLNPTSLPPDESQVSSGLLVKGAEDQTSPYVFIVTVTGDGLAEDDTTASTSAELSPIIDESVLTPTPTVDPETLDPNAVDPIVTKTADVENAQPGDTVNWTVVIRNGGTAAQSNVTLQDAVPDTLTINTATADSGAPIVDGQLVTWAASSMQPGQEVTITLETVVGAEVESPSTISNTVCASREGGEQICETAAVNIGPDVETLPSTGVASRLDASRLGALLLWLSMLGGGFLLLFSAQVSDRRMLIAGALLLVALALVVAVVSLVLLGGDDDEEPTDAAQVATATPASLGEESGETPAAPAATPEPDDGDGLPAGVDPDAVVFDFPPTATPYVLPTPSGARYLMIPKLAEQFKVPVPVVEVPIEDRKWDVSGLGFYVGWLEGTTWFASDWGNTVLAAHVQLGTNNPGPFWGLGELAPGDEIVVVEGETERRFEVVSKATVPPEDWSVTAPTDSPMLTLITCTEWDRAYGVFSERMVVRAVPIGSGVATGG